MCKTIAPQNILTSLRSSRTRRNLFGPLDHAQLKLEYQNNLSKDREEASHRWGFDFLSGKPLHDADFQWEGVPDTTVPYLYRPCIVGRVDGQTVRMVEASKGGVQADPSKSGKEKIPCTNKRYTVNPQNLEKIPEMEGNEKLKRNQTIITDFYQAKRRAVETPQKLGHRFFGGSWWEGNNCPTEPSEPTSNTT